MRLFKRGDVYYVEFGRGDKQSLKTTDEKAAQRMFAKLQKEWLMGRLIRLDPDSGITLRDFKTEYLKTRDSMASKTKAHDELALRQLESAIGAKIQLRLIDAKKIEDFKRLALAGALSENSRPLKPVSVNSYLRQIKAALKTAVVWGYLKAPPSIKFCPMGKKLPRYLRPEAITAVLAKGEELYPGFGVMLNFYLWTGARRSEAIDLTWKDCHLDGNSPHVMLTGKGNRQRIVPLAPSLVAQLERIRKDVGPVFPPKSQSAITMRFHRTVLACDPPVAARLHDLRHSAATYMLAHGMSIRAVQEILGHAHLATTAGYADIIKAQLHREIGKLRFTLD